MPYDVLSDETLVQLIGRRDSSAFSALFDRYTPQMLAVAMIVARDQTAAEAVVEQVFHDLWQRPEPATTGGASVRNKLMLSARRLAEQLPRSEA